MEIRILLHVPTTSAGTIKLYSIQPESLTTSTVYVSESALLGCELRPGPRSASGPESRARSWLEAMGLGAICHFQAVEAKDVKSDRGSSAHPELSNPSIDCG